MPLRVDVAIVATLRKYLPFEGRAVKSDHNPKRYFSCFRLNTVYCNVRADAAVDNNFNCRGGFGSEQT